MEGNFTLPRPNSPQRTRRTQRVDGFHDTLPISHRGHRAGGYPSPHNTNDRSLRAKRGGLEVVTTVGRQAKGWTTQPPGSAPAHFHRSLGRCPRDDDHRTRLRAHPSRLRGESVQGAWREGKSDSPEGVQAPAGRPRDRLAKRAFAYEIASSAPPPRNDGTRFLPAPYSLFPAPHCSLFIDHCSLASPHHSTICRPAAYLL